MNQKEKIISLLQVNGIMTQGELAEAIYGDKLHTLNIYSALVSLVNNNVITRSGAHPAKYALNGAPISEQVKEIKKNNLPKRENTEEQQYKAQQQTVTMSAEYASSNQCHLWHWQHRQDMRRHQPAFDCRSYRKLYPL